MISCAITGHRPTRFKFGYKENTSGCKRLKKRLHDQFVILYEQGIRRFYVGGALGVDLWAGEILLTLKEQPEYNDIELIVALPFPSHDKSWDDRSKSRLAYLVQYSTKVITISETSGAEAYKKRNYYLIDHADILLAVYDKNSSIRSSTGVAVNYAKKKNLYIIFICPYTGKISLNNL